MLLCANHDASSSPGCTTFVLAPDGHTDVQAKHRMHVLSASWDKSVIAWDAEYMSMHKEYHHHKVWRLSCSNQACDDSEFSQDAVSCLVEDEVDGTIWSGSWDNTLAKWKVQ